MNLKSIPKKIKNLESEKVEDETIILLLETGKFYQLNRTGIFIWNLINGKRNVEDIIGSMYKEFTVEKESLIKDVIETLKLMKKKKILYFS